MIVEPYRLRPVAPTVALLTPDGDPVDEHGELLNLDEWPAGTRLWASYETVYALVRAGRGEALCWNGEEIRWRHRRHEDDWRSRPSDACVIKLPFDEDQPQVTLEALARWRDWLAGYGASPTGTSGSAAWSLLRARLEKRLVTGAGERPPIVQTLGGRQELGPAGQGRFEGRLTLLDLPAAYAGTLSTLRYGGCWLETDGTPGRDLERYAGTDTPCFVRAAVRVPDGLTLGPLVRRPRRRVRGYMESRLLASEYPVGRRLQGVWTWEELHQAEQAGCRIERIIGGWVHRSGWRPFLPWWEAVEEGRRMPGLAGQLAKVTGNALWGRFAMDPALNGVRTVRSHHGRLVARALPQRPYPWPAHDLAETVSGRVRARLYAGMILAGDRFLSAHTDGIWEADDVDAEEAPDGWRVKQHARRLELLDPQVLRYWPRPRSRFEPRVVFSGVPAQRAGEMFEQAWQRAGLA